MAIAADVDTIDVNALLADTLGPQARSFALAEYARQVKKEVEGGEGNYSVFVDGRKDASEDAVKHEGEIEYRFTYLNDVFLFIAKTLIENSPVSSGRYASSHRFYADGTQFDPAGVIPDASEYLVTSIEPYAQKIEGRPGKSGESPQFPNGLYEATAALAQEQFGFIMRIEFEYVAITDGDTGSAVTASTKRISAHRRGSHPDQWFTHQPAISVIKRGQFT